MMPPRFAPSILGRNLLYSPITLTLGSGQRTFLFDSADSDNTRGNAICYNVSQNVTIVGNGPTTSILKAGSTGPNLSCGLMKAGNGNFGSTNKWTARLNSVSAGVSTVTCKTPAETAQFSVNTWALIHRPRYDGIRSATEPVLV